MKKYYLIVLIFLVAIFLPIRASAYEKYSPIKLTDIHATAENPYVIEGYEISNPNGNCITILNSEHVIIKSNYLHDCGTDERFRDKTDHYREGYAVLIGDSSNITFEHNNLEKNFRGFMAYNTPHLLARNNIITSTLQYSPLWCERCSYSEFSHNYLSDNGYPEGFWVPSQRSIGIWIKRSDNVRIHDNTILRSTSDGIAVTGHIYTPSFTSQGERSSTGPQADWSGLSSNIEIYNNLILDNMEQGVWLVNGRGIKVYNNTIRTGCFTYGSPISTEFNVGDSEFYNNKLLGCLNTMVGGANSFNIYVHDNTFYSYDGSKGDFASFSDDFLGVGELANRQDADYQISSGNKEENNTWLSIKGNLSEEMKEKVEYAKKYETYSAKGWMACENNNGTIDEICKKREEAKGEQGVPRKMLFYSSLMEDFDLFVEENLLGKISNVLREKEQKEREIQVVSHNKTELTGIKYVAEQLIESWKATTGVVIIIAVSALIICLKRKKR